MDSHPPSSARRVLLVEDNPTNVELARRILSRRAGLAVEAAGTGASAVESWTTSPPDLILLDLHLPDASGVDLFRQLRSDQRTASIPVVVVSGDTSGQRLADEDGDSQLAVLHKPFTAAELLSVVDAALGVTGLPAPGQGATPVESWRGAHRGPWPAGRDADDDPVSDDPADDDPADDELVQLFLRRTATDLDRLQRAVEAGNVALAEDVAHSVRGGASFFGAEALSGVCGTVEQQARAGELLHLRDLVDEAQVAFHRFQTEHDQRAH